MKELDFKEVQKVNEKLQAIDPAFLSASPELCKQTAIWCAAMKAYTGEQMAIAKKEWNDTKSSAYESYAFNQSAWENNGTGKKNPVDRYGVMVLKDYINAKCAEKESRFLYIERTNNAAGAMEDILITCISFEKQMLYLSTQAT